ncbi:MAG: hypothetical protein K8T91_09985 [Planctomycetes bacterium]|nr:hypothetical protein [Planctomycetota bacterium]
MALEHLDEAEQAIVLGCLRAVVNGPFFPDWEFRTAFGLKRSEMADILARWQVLSESNEMVSAGINNAMNNLLIWWGWQDDNPEQGAQVLKQWAGTTADDIERVFDKWRAGRIGGLA